MMLLLFLLICGLLLLITYQDYKYRGVSWYLFPLMFVLFSAWSLKQTAVGDFIRNASFNLAFVMLQMLLITLYFSVKNRALVNITKGFLGLGDILFLLGLCLVFSPLNYIAYYLCSLVITVILVVALKVFKLEVQKIPLAGIQALLLLPLLCSEYLEKLSLINDEALLQFLIL